MDRLKKIMMMVLIAIALLSTQISYAQAKKKAQSNVLYKFEIKKDALPEAVKKALARRGFRRLTINKIYRVKTKEKDKSGKAIEAYEVETVKDKRIKVFMFDKDGNVKNEEE